MPADPIPIALDGRRSIMHGGDRLAGVLEQHGVRSVFTLCGGHISPVLSAAKQGGIRIVDVRDEATAVFAADATARLTGTPGFAAVTAGPGVTNTITAIKNAQLAQSPVVILGGAAPTILKGKGALQDIDQLALVRATVKRARTVKRVRDLGPELDAAFAAAREGVPGPVFVECPVDLLYDEATVRGWYAQGAPRGGSIPARLARRYLGFHLDRQFAAGPANEAVPVPRNRDEPIPRDVERVHEALASADRPLLVVGSQAVLDPDRVAETAAAIERLNVPAYLSGMARGLLGRNHRLHLRHKRRDALREADCVVLAGVPCDFRLDYGGHVARRACLVSVNRSRRDLRMNRKPTIGIRTDPGTFLRSIAGSRPEGRADRSAWLGGLRARDDAREREIAVSASTESRHVNPLRLLREIDAALADDSVIVADGGDFVATASYTVRPHGPLSWLDPGVFGTLGVGAGFALGAKLARPESETWIVFGDGAFGYGLIEFESFARLGVPVIAVVGNDASWAQIAREQVKVLDDDVATVLSRADYHLAVEGLGGKGFLLDKHEDIATVLQEAKAAAAAGRPVLINAILDRSDFRDGSISV